MSLTPEQVLIELAKTKRFVEPRTLTDWRARKMLPSLSHKSRGKTKGKVYYWEQTNIVDQAAFVADLGGKTAHTLLALWCCGFTVDLEALRIAWLEMIGSLSKDWVKQDMNLVTERRGQNYFDELSDQFHKVTAAAARQSAALNRRLPDNPYELSQAALFLIFCPQLPEDFEDELDAINQFINHLSPDSDKKTAQDSQILVARNHVMNIRKFVNLFAIKKAVRDASYIELEQVQQFFETFIHFLELACGFQPASQFGLSQARILRASLGPVALAILLGILRLPSGSSLVALFEVFARHVNDWEAGIKRGPVTNDQRILVIPDSTAAQFRKDAAPLWQQFLDGVARDLRPNEMPINCSE